MARSRNAPVSPPPSDSPFLLRPFTTVCCRGIVVLNESHAVPIAVAAAACIHLARPPVSASYRFVTPSVSRRHEACSCFAPLPSAQPQQPQPSPEACGEIEPKTNPPAVLCTIQGNRPRLNIDLVYGSGGRLVDGARSVGE